MKLFLLLLLSLPAMGETITQVVNGYVTLASTTIAPIEASVYTEQSTGAQRSLKSSSANDTSAGTGARSVTITYLDSSGNGPNVETDTLNGTTAVLTTATNICFIESIVVASVGSGGVNAGAISLYAATSGTGTVIGSVNTGDQQTYWAHHYVPAGVTQHVGSFTGGTNNATLANGGVFGVKSISIPTANIPTLQLSDFVTVFGASNTVIRQFQNGTLFVIGPSRITEYVIPQSSTSELFRGSFEYY